MPNPPIVNLGIINPKGKHAGPEQLDPQAWTGVQRSQCAPILLMCLVRRDVAMRLFQPRLFLLQMMSAMIRAFAKSTRQAGCQAWQLAAALHGSQPHPASQQLHLVADYSDLTGCCGPASDCGGSNCTSCSCSCCQSRREGAYQPVSSSGPTQPLHPELAAFRNSRKSSFATFATPPSAMGCPPSASHSTLPASQHRLLHGGRPALSEQQQKSGEPPAKPSEWFVSKKMTHDELWMAALKGKMGYWVKQVRQTNENYNALSDTAGNILFGWNVRFWA